MLAVLASISLGLAITVIANEAMRVVPLVPPDLIEERRRARLAAASMIYREFPHGVQRLNAFFEPWLVTRRDRIQRLLRTLGEDDWKPGEFLAVKLITTSAALAVAFVAASFVLEWNLALAGTIALAVATPWLVVNGLEDEARKRIRMIRQRLPFSLDLMALILEAGGGSLVQCLRAAVRETHGHPISLEFARVVHGMEKGRTVPEAFRDFRERIDDAEVSEIARDLVAANERGIPLKQSLRDVAARLRLFQIQWQEKASEEAKVHIVWPTILIMCACLIIVAVPFLFGIGS